MSPFSFGSADHSLKNRRKLASWTDGRPYPSANELPPKLSTDAASLPIEIWQDIFLFFVELQDGDTQWLTRERRVRLLCNVSPYWRKTCSQMSSLWTTISFSTLFRGPFWSSLSHVDESLIHSGTRTVSINTIFTESRDFNGFIERIQAHAPRIKSLFLRSNVLRAPTSALLRTDHWRIMTSLKSLTLENIRFFSDTEFLVFLSRCAVLENLRVGGISWGIVQQRRNTSLVLPHLDTLICDAYLFFAFVAIDLDFPSLREFTLLNVEFNLPWPFLLTGVTFANTPPLERLVVSGCISAQGITGLLALFPTTTHLILDWTNANYNEFDALANEQPNQHPGPNLESLTLIRTRIDLHNAQSIMNFLDRRKTSSWARYHDVRVHLKQCDGVHRTLSDAVDSNGGSVEEYTGGSLNWRDNDYARFGMCYYPPRRA